MKSNKLKTLSIAACYVVAALYSVTQGMDSDSDSNDISYSKNTNYVFKEVKDIFEEFTHYKENKYFKIKEEIHRFSNSLGKIDDHRILDNIVDLTKKIANKVSDIKNLFECMGLIIYEKAEHKNSNDDVLYLLNNYKHVFVIEKFMKDMVYITLDFEYLEKKYSKENGFHIILRTGVQSDIERRLKSAKNTVCLNFSNIIWLSDVHVYRNILDLCKDYNNVEVETIAENQVNPALYDSTILATVDFDNWKEQSRKQYLERGEKEQRAYQRKEEGKSSDSDND